MHSKPVRRGCLHFFKDFKMQCTFKGLMKLKLLLKPFLIKILLNLELAVNQNMTNEVCFGSLCRNLTCNVTLTPRKAHICEINLMLPYFNHLQLFFEARIKSRQVKSFTSNQYLKLPAFLKFYNTVSVLRVRLFTIQHL